MSRHSAYDDGHVMESEDANHQRQNDKKTDHIGRGSERPEKEARFFSFSFYIFCFFGYFTPEMVVPVDELLLIGEVELFPGVSYKVKEGKRLSTVIYWFYLKKK